MPTRVCRGTLVLRLAHRGGQLQSRAYRPLGLVLMGLRIAKIHQDAVAHVFCDEPAEAAHRFGDALLIGGNDLAQVLGVHARRQRGRAHQVGEHHRDLAALSRVGRRLLDCRKNVGWRSFRDCVGAQGGDRIEQLAAVPDKTDTQFLQVLSRQAMQDCVVDFVLAERRLILSDAEASQPISDVHVGILTPP